MKKRRGMNLIEFVLLSTVIFIITYFGINYFSDFLSQMFGDAQYTKMYTKDATRIQRDSD